MNTFIGKTQSGIPFPTEIIDPYKGYETHPSVRIKGTESNYNPVQCYDQSCPNKNIHMHCPFCVKTDYYQDPVILKAHYRVKHVDKGIDFAGLKVLRCCDHCDIVGIIKGEKKFKGAHWHCYKCRNGFNRRDEAVKHYKTHFRNPQTTFQIQIAQEVNNPNSGYDDENNSSTFEHGMSIHPALTEAITCMSSSMAEEQGLLTHTTQPNHLSNGKTPDGTLHVSVAANETVDTSDTQTHHIMIIQEDSSGAENPYTTQIISSNDLNNSEEKEPSEQITLERKCEELQQKYQDLYVSKTEEEQQLKAEINQLKSQIKDLQEDIVTYQKREQALLEQLSVPLDKNIEILLKQLENQHRDLLHQQLLSLKREYQPPQVFTPIQPKSSISISSNNTGEGVEDSSYDENISASEQQELQEQIISENSSLPLQQNENPNESDSSKVVSCDESASDNSLIEKQTSEILLNSDSSLKLVSENSFSKNGEETIEMGTDCAQVRIQDAIEGQGQIQGSNAPFVVCIEYSDGGTNLIKSATLTENVDLSSLTSTPGTTLELTGDLEEPPAKRLKQ